jgi:putative oxidoreductase
MPSTLRARASLALSWALQLGLAYIFARAGTAKLVSDPEMIRIFNWIGFGQWFRYVSGVVEVVGVVLILLPRFSVVGGLWLMATMFVAVLINVLITHSNPLPPIVLFVVAAAVTFLRWDQLLRLRKWGMTWWPGSNQIKE